MSYVGCVECNLHLPKRSRRFSISASKTNKSDTEKYGEEDLVDKVSKKKGTIAGAVALIIGTSIGSGILALPQYTSPAGLLPSSTTLTVCWAFLLIEALLLVEINVALMRKRRINVNEDEFEVISIRTMAQETLGEWGGFFSTVIYVFLGYSSMVAYNSKSGEIINHMIDISYPVSGVLFPVLFGVLLFLGGTRATDQVNQWLTASMIGLLLAIEILIIVLGGWTGLEGSGDWGKVPPTIPVIIFSLVYHDLAPVLCAYLGGDLERIRTSVLLGSIVPLLALLVWNAIALGLSSHANQVVDPIELLISMRQSGVSFIVETFSLLAVGTSLIGTLLGFSEFFKEQFIELSRNSLSIKKQQKLYGLRKWWTKNKVNFTAIALVIAPSIAVSTTVPDAFSAATEIAGGYCMTILYGVLPSSMAWSMYNKNGENKDITDNKVISTYRPALLGVGIFASALVLEQIFQDLSFLHHPNPIGSGLAHEAIVEAGGPECIVPGQTVPIKLLGLKHPNPIGSGLAHEAIVEAGGPECIVPGQTVPIKLLGLKGPGLYLFGS